MRSTFAEFKKKALQDPEVRKEYENLKPVFEIKKQLIKVRLKRKLIQEKLAKKIEI